MDEEPSSKARRTSRQMNSFFKKGMGEEEMA